MYLLFLIICVSVNTFQMDTIMDHGITGYLDKTCNVYIVFGIFRFIDDTHNEMFCVISSGI